MRDGHTRRLDRRDAKTPWDGYLQTHDVRLVAVNGKNAGAQYPVGAQRCILGRGPGVDLQIDDQAMSRQHAALEFDGSGFRIRDLGSTNGLAVNGRVVQVSELANGDRIEIGSQVFRYVVEALQSEPEVYELTPEG